ncbi:MAG TPA: hypothetical protein VHD33_00030 [Legionellaceae bacterium]|nr:hypothetical protein [Legionellaceae bacterium]
MKKYYIKVTQEDINNGVAGSAMSCPIARAITRRFGLKENPKVGSLVATYWTKDNELRQFQLPYQAKEFIYNFDNQLGVKPISFEIFREL